MATVRIALKEWAVVCEALAQGRQQVLFRKGGIHEGPEGFRPEHAEFWLFPTGFHQSTDSVRPEFSTQAQTVLDNSPAPDRIPIQHFCRVESVSWVEDLEKLAQLRPFHILTDAAIAARYNYRRPGLFVLLVHTKSLPQPMEIPNDPRYDGCRSWVSLNEPLPLSGLVEPVEDSATSARQLLREILRQGT